MTINEFLTKEQLPSQAALARYLGVAPQSLTNYLNRDSPTFAMLMHNHFPEWSVEYTPDGWRFHRLTDADGAVVHKYTRADLLVDNDELNSNPAVFAFFAALQEWPVDLSLDHEQRVVRVSRGRVILASFPFYQVPHLVRSLRGDW